MPERTEFLLERVAAAQTRANAATLENVRQSHLRSVEAWRKLANRSAKADIIKLEDAARRAARDLEQRLEETR